MHTVYIFRTLEEHKGLCFPVAMTLLIFHVSLPSLCVWVYVGEVKTHTFAVS